MSARVQAIDFEKQYIMERLVTILDGEFAVTGDQNALCLALPECDREARSERPFAEFDADLLADVLCTGVVNSLAATGLLRLVEISYERSPYVIKIKILGGAS